MSHIKAVFAKQRLNGIACLVPMDEDGRQMLETMSAFKPAMVTVHVPRNPAHHRLLFALYQLLVDGGVWEGDQDRFLDWCKYGTGHVRRSLDHLGQMHYVPKSINFESMDQTRFARFFDRVCYLVWDRLLAKDGEWEALRERASNMIEKGYNSLGHQR